MNTKLKKASARAGLAVLILIGALLSIRAILNYTTGKKLDAFLAEARSKGIPLSLKEIAPSCDDVDNGARFWKAAEALFLIPEAKDKGLAYKTAIHQSIRDLFNGNGLEEKSRGQLVELISLNRRSLDLMIEASDRPCFRYLDWTTGKFFEKDQLRAAEILHATSLLGVDSVLKSDAGRTKEALDQLRSGMAFARRTLDEPFLLDALVALANFKSLCVCLGSITQGRDLDTEILTSWIHELDPAPWRKRFWRCLEMERLAELEIDLDLMQGDREARNGWGSWDNGFYYWLIRPLGKSQIVWLQKKYLDLQKNGGLPYYELAGRSKSGRLSSGSLPWYHVLTGLLFTDFEGVFIREAEFEAMMLTTKAGLACKVYKKQNGHYPESLAALSPGLLDSVPLDPFTGKPLVYRLRDEGVLIYSLGANEKDDGGRGTYARTQPIMDKDDDWAWRESAVPSPAPRTW